MEFTVEPDSNLVQSIVGDKEAVAQLIRENGMLTQRVLTDWYVHLAGEVKSQAREIAQLKLVIEGMKMERDKLERQLKVRFKGVDERVGQLETKVKGGE